jgi:hypothetical protein
MSDERISVKFEDKDRISVSTRCYEMLAISLSSAVMQAQLSNTEKISITMETDSGD